MKISVAVVAVLTGFLCPIFYNNVVTHADARPRHVAKGKADAWSRFNPEAGTWRAAEFVTTINSKKQPSKYVYTVSDANDLDKLTQFLCWRYARGNRAAEVEVKATWAEDHSSEVDCTCEYDPTDNRSWPPEFLGKH